MPLLETAASGVEGDLVWCLAERLAGIPSEKRREICSHAELLDGAADETIRLQSERFIPRVAIGPTWIGKSEISAGDRLLLMMGDIGRD